MGKLSNYAKNKMLNHLFGLETYTPTDCYLGLFSGDPESGGVEANGNGYSRVLIDFWKIGSDLCINTSNTFDNGCQVGRTASYVFDDSNTGYASDAYMSENGNSNNLFGYNFGEGNEKLITGYTVTKVPDRDNYTPTWWDFQGSNDSTDGVDGTWDTLHSVSSLVWSSGAETKSYVVNNTNSYRMYRWYLGDQVVEIGEAEMVSLFEIEIKSKNQSQVTFPQATGSWGGEIDYYAIFDDNDNILGTSQPSTPFNVTSGEAPFVSAETIEIKINSGTNKGLTDYAKVNLLNMIFAKVSYSNPGLYLAIGQNNPSSGSFSEMVGSGYGRKLISAYYINTSSNGTIINSEDIVLNSPTQNDWSEMQSLVVVDASDNMLFYDYGSITNQTPTMEDALIISTGSFSIGID